VKHFEDIEFKGSTILRYIKTSTATEFELAT